MSKKNKKNSFKNKSGLNKKELKKLILEIFYQNPKKIYNYKQFAAKLSIKDIVTLKLISVVLQELADDGYLLQHERGKFLLKEKTGYIVGKVEMTQKGYAFIISEELDEDVFVAGTNLNKALNGDKVRVFILAKRKRKQPEGEVGIIKISESSRSYAYKRTGRSGR